MTKNEIEFIKLLNEDLDGKHTFYANIYSLDINKLSTYERIEIKRLLHYIQRYNEDIYLDKFEKIISEMGERYTFIQNIPFDNPTSLSELYNEVSHNEDTRISSQVLFDKENKGQILLIERLLIPTKTYRNLEEKYRLYQCINKDFINKYPQVATSL